MNNIKFEIGKYYKMKSDKVFRILDYNKEEKEFKILIDDNGVRKIYYATESLLKGILCKEVK